MGILISRVVLQEGPAFGAPGGSLCERGHAVEGAGYFVQSGRVHTHYDDWMKLKDEILQLGGSSTPYLTPHFSFLDTPASDLEVGMERHEP